MGESKKTDSTDKKILSGCLMLILLFFAAAWYTMHSKGTLQKRDGFANAIETTIIISLDGKEYEYSREKSFMVHLPERSSFMAIARYWHIDEYERVTDEITREELEKLGGLSNLPQKTYLQLKPSESGTGIHTIENPVRVRSGDVVVFYENHMSEICEMMHLWYEPTEAWMVLDSTFAVEVQFVGADFHVVEGGARLDLLEAKSESGF